MSDIVERLRGLRPVSAFNAAGVVERYDASPALLDLEAANEIEALRAVIRELLPNDYEVRKRLTFKQAEAIFPPTT